MRWAARTAGLLIAAAVAALALTNLRTPDSNWSPVRGPAPEMQPEVSAITHVVDDEAKGWRAGLWRLVSLAIAACTIAGCVLLTLTAAAFALERSRLERLDTETASKLAADYSADPRGIELPPLDLDVVRAAARDEQALNDTPDEAERIDVVHAPPDIPEQPIDGPVEPPASGPDPTATPRAEPTDAPPVIVPPTAAPRSPTPTPFIVTNTPTTTDTPRPTATRTPTLRPTNTANPTNTAPPTRTPTSRPTGTATAVRTATPTLIATALPAATATDEPLATPTSVPIATPVPTATVEASPTPERTGTPLPTPTRVLTETATPRLTDTPAPTALPTLGPTRTPTSVATAVISTPTAIAATATVTAVPSATPTGVPTSAPKPTDTPTSPVTPTPTVAATPTPTRVPANVFVDPVTQTVTVGGTVSIDVRVAGAIDLGSYAFTLTRDGSVLGYISVTNSSFLGSTGRTVICPAPATTSNSVAFSCDSAGAGAGPNGIGILASVQMSAANPGTSALVLSGVSLKDTSGATLPITVTGGTTTVTTASATPTSTPTPTPVTVTLASTKDAFVRQVGPTTNFGADDAFQVNGQSTAKERSLLEFDVSSIPGGSTILSAVVTICYRSVAPPETVGRVHEIRAALSAWVESAVTWNTQPASSGTATASFTVSDSVVCHTVAVAADVTAWVGGAANFGWVLKDQDETSSGTSNAKYASKEHATGALRPSLTVTYLPP